MSKNRRLYGIKKIECQNVFVINLAVSFQPLSQKIKRFGLFQNRYWKKKIAKNWPACIGLSGPTLVPAGRGRTQVQWALVQIQPMIRTPLASAHKREPLGST